MALSPSEMQQVRRALGYGNLLASARPYFDIQLIFEDVVQQNLDPAWGEGYIRTTILPEILNIELQVISSRQKLGVLELTGDAVIDGEQEFRGLSNLLEFWKNELSLILRIPRADRPSKGAGWDITVT
jgi:hypothetical protein